MTLVLLGLLGQAAVADVLDGAREVAPLLRGIERRLPARVAVRPDALPPSPFSGQRATLFAFSVSRERQALDESTRSARRDLLAWQASPHAHPGTAPLAGAWMEQLVMLVEDMALQPDGAGPDCGVACTVSVLSDPREAFGATPRERQETRDLVLLEALQAAAAGLPRR